MKAHPYDSAALSILGRDRVATDPAHCPIVGSRPAVVVRYGCDSQGRGQWIATLKRAPRDRPARLAVPAMDGPDAAAAALISRQGLAWRVLTAPASLDGGETYAYTMAHPGETQALAAGPRAVWALAAAAELEAISAGADPADPADPLALPLAMARIATGTDHPRPIVAGWAMGPAAAPGGVILTDVMGDPIEGLSFPDSLSAAGALAAALAAGWLLTAPMRATAHRLANVCGADPDPAAVAQALAARGGCPAVIATLSAKGAAL